MRIIKENTFDFWILMSMYLQLVILEFWGCGVFLDKFISVVIIFRILLWGKRQWRTGLLCGIALAIVFFISTFSGEEFIFSNARVNFFAQVYPMIYTYFVVLLCKNKPEFIEACLKKGYWIFNITIILNIIVMFIQLLFPYSINAVEVGGTITYYEDLVSGLFQYASSHVVCMFTIFIVLYNIVFFRRTKTKLLKNTKFIYLIALIVTSIYIATRNDNKALFIFLPISLFAYWLAYTSIERKKIVRMFFMSVGMCAIFLFLWFVFPIVQEYVDTYIIRLVKVAVNAVTKGTAAQGSDERIAIIFYSLRMNSTWLFGKGFGSAAMYSAGYMGFKHFGQSDIGSVLTLGGIWYTILLVVFYLKGFNIIADSGNSKRKKGKLWGIVIIVIAAFVYTQCFSRTNLIITLLLIMGTFRLDDDKLVRKGVKE